MEIVRGRSGSIQVIFYSVWTGQDSTSTRANITGASFRFMAKAQVSDPDSAALISKTTATITDGPNGVASFSITATDTNTISQGRLVCEAVAKLVDGTYAGGGVDDLVLKPNVVHSLF